ncbi:PHD finger protein [Salix suchowensis]|nr:PHD finger protein [Salix suchowensis]
MVVNGRPIKRMKRRVTADLYNFLSFPSSPSSSSSSYSPPPPRGPFRSNIRSFLTEHALLPPPSSLFPHLLTWQISFQVGDLVECSGADAGGGVVCLDVVEEDVARSRSVYCDQCRVVGWSGHPVCSKRYHFIIKADGNSIGGYHKPCTCCGDVLHLSESRCKTCNHVTTADDVEEWVYHQLEDTTHLLHGVIHANGYGHLLRVNGKEGGSRLLSGVHIMDFWDRLCKTLGVRKVSVMDVSKKYGLEYRLLHAITKGHSWYGDWGYEFGAGSFGLTVHAYKSAVEALYSLPLSIFLSEGQKLQTRLLDIIKFYQSLSDQELVNIRDLFFSSRADDFSCKKRCIYASGISSSWSRSDIERVEEAMFRVLRAVSGSNWVSWRALRGAVCKVAPPELLDHCLKEIGGKFAADGMIVRSRCNPSSGSLEYRKPYTDLRFLYDNMLHPQTMMATSDAISSARKLLDCKQFMKDYNKCETHHPKSTYYMPVIKCPGSSPRNNCPASNATVFDLKLEATRAFQDVYLMFRRFHAEELLGYSGVDDSTQVKLLIGSTTESVRVRGRCMGKNGLRWTVDCCCGAKDDDGERMLACDVCGVWQHTRCSGIPDSDPVPAKFVCLRCRGVSLVTKPGSVVK